MSLTSNNNIYNNYNISSNMSRNISYRLKRLNNIVDKLNEADEVIKTTNIYITKENGRRKKTGEKKETANRKALGKQIKDLYEDRTIKQSDKIEKY